MSNIIKKGAVFIIIVFILICSVSCSNENSTEQKVDAKQGDAVNAAMEIWSEFLPKYGEALRIIYSSLEINSEVMDEVGFLVTDQYRSIKELEDALNAVFTPEFIEEKIDTEINLFDGENAMYHEKQGELYLKACEVYRFLFDAGNTEPAFIELNDSTLIVKFDNIDDGFGGKYIISFTLCNDELNTWKLNGYEEVTCP